MPQGRRKVPFSGKAKKEQLKSKRQTKQGPSSTQGKRVMLLKRNDSESSDTESDVLKVNLQPTKGGRIGSKHDPNRYVLQFHRETDAEVELLKELSYKAIKPVDRKELEINADVFYPDCLSFPKRPPWYAIMTRHELEASEHRYFTEYIKDIENRYNWKELGYFELNLETWRQLWRVLEMSDILLFIVDIRFAAAMFPPSLYNFITQTLRKQMILIINKIDLAPSHLVVAWMHYFKTKYPELRILTFTTLPSYNLRQAEEPTKSKLQIRRKLGKQKMAAEGAQKLLETCRELVGDNVDLTRWEAKIAEEMNSEYEETEVGIKVENVVDTSFISPVKFSLGILTIGCVGQPNVGKSSIMNALMGKKVVSISRTPGHTKHFQTIYLTNNVRLCDCPGLVFPSKVPKNLQVLMGTFPIAQLKFPYSALQFIAERLDLVDLLKLKHPNNDEEWSTMDLCEAWAIKRGYLTAKAARPDTYRAANSLLRMQLDGKICLCLLPPEFCENEEKWKNHPANSSVQFVQASNNLKINSMDDDGSSASTLDSLNDSEDSSTNNSSEMDSEDDDDSSEANCTTAQNKFALLGNDD